jgi:leucyl-tRNA synthetase
VVDPESILESHGADAVRLFMMFTAPPEQSLEWLDAGIDGAARFLRRFWRLAQDHVARGMAPTLTPPALSKEQRELRRKVHDTVAKIDDDVGRRYHFNTAIAAAMELTNALQKFDTAGEQGHAVMQEALSVLVAALSPIVPHLCHRLWSALGHTGAVIDAPWPVADPDARRAESVVVVIQVDGKLRGKVTLAPSAPQAEAVAAAMAEAGIVRFLGGRPVGKIIYVPGRLLNLVLE